MASPLDPEETSPGPVAADTQSSDQSKPGLRKAWDAWTSRPENNAALLQFGIAMLQPRSPGQSGIGSVANAVGEGAQASDRVQATARAEEKAASAQSLEEAKTAATTSNAASTAANAAAYGRSVDNAGTGTSGKGMSGTLKIQADFRKWLAKPEDTTGLTSDPVLGAIQRTFPNVKSKADLLADPRAYAAAQKLFSASVTTEAGDPEAEVGGSPTPVAPQTSQGGPRTVYNAQGKPFTWDGVPGHAPVPQ